MLCFAVCFPFLLLLLELLVSLFVLDVGAGGGDGVDVGGNGVAA